MSVTVGTSSQSVPYSMLSAQDYLEGKLLISASFVSVSTPPPAAPNLVSLESGHASATKDGSVCEAVVCSSPLPQEKDILIIIKYLHQKQ